MLFCHDKRNLIFMVALKMHECTTRKEIRTILCLSNRMYLTFGGYYMQIPV